MSGEIEAGRELDCEVARRVMGGTKIELGTIMGEVGFPDSRDWMGYFGDFYTVVPEYSTEIGAAWSVVEKMREMFDVVSFSVEDGLWEVECYESIDYDTAKRHDGSEPRRHAIIAGASSLPEALCRAALAAMGAQRGEK